MKCPNCNETFTANSKFCSSCGAKIESNIETSHSEIRNNESTGAENTEKSNKINIKKAIPIVVVVVLIIGLTIIMGGGNKPHDTVETFLKSIAKGDAENFIDTLNPSLKNSLMDEVGRNMMNVEEELYYMNEEIIYELGNDWLSKIETTTVYEDDYQAEVVVSVKGNSELSPESLRLIKQDKNWVIVEE